MKKTLAAAIGLSTVLLLATCSSGGGEAVRVSFNLQKARSRGILPNAADYPCFGVIVTGEGIASLEAGTGNRLPSDRCPYAGAASKFVPLVTSGVGSSAQLEALVPAGKNRLIQVVALEYSSATACPDGTVAQFIRATNQNTAPSGYGGLYEVGYVIKDLFVDTEIQIANSYNSGTAQNLRGCSSGGASLSLSPAGSALQVRSGSTVQFSASGGTPPYSFSKTGTGTVDALGSYVADSGGGQTGAVTVTDSLGNSATTSLTTFYRASPPVAWYAAESFGNAAGTAVGSWTSLGNAGSLSLSGTATLVPSAVNGFPAVRVDFGGYYSVSLSSGTVGAVHAMVVARAAYTGSTFFCIAPSGSCGTTHYKLFTSGNPLVLQGSANNGSDDSSVGSPTVGSDFFLAELYADLNGTAGVQLVTASGSLDGVNSAGSIPLALSGGSAKLFVGKTSTGTLDIAEVVVDYDPTGLAMPTATIAYLKAKYQLP